MKKYFIPFLILGTSMLYSCTKEEIISDTNSSSTEKVKMEFKAGIDAISRTVLTTNNVVEWKEDDAISLFDSNSNNKFTTSTGGSSVIFTGSAQNNLETYYALYPYDANAVLSGSVITTTLPAEQVAFEGSFANMLNPSVAKSVSDKTLAFKNACALVKFTLQYTGNNNITKVKFRGNNGEALAGTIHIDASSVTHSATVEADFAETEVTLSGEFSSGATYYFVTAPATLSNGLTLVFYDDNNNEWQKVGNTSVILTAGKILNLNEVTPGNFVPSQGYKIIDGVYHVYNADGLLTWASQEDHLSSNVILEADIDMNGKSWNPIGNDITEGYSGNFDGNGKYIHNLNVNVTNGNAGFFGGLAASGKVHDVKFSGAKITGSSSVGVIAGESLGMIDKCNVRDSEVAGGIYAGTVTGNNSLQVNNCNVQNVTVSGNSAGGVAGVNYGKIEYCTASGNNTKITSTGQSAGGIVGSNSEEGGTKTSGRILKCAVYEITISGNRAGGIAGENGFGTVAQCVVDKCTVIHNSTGNSANLGGVVGYNARGEVVASYSANSIVGAGNLTSEAIGGIVGYNLNSTSSPAYIYGCYSTHVSLLGNAGNNIGAIAGYNNGHVTSCYAVLPDNVSGIKLVGINNAVNGIDHCVEVGEENYNDLEKAENLKVTDGTIWKAAEIWEITAGGFPSVNADYIGEVSSN
ncbi:fimbrillin family protein [uncultured Bacteroides sp.]|uniref:fimbrillin family protein n=1 Tax=uncultured Bacteroides sp. TaxID=162156 RepID=UPI0026168BB2|nr:fimbrillin family protein [uncultured Bacteroides sp.]